MVACKKEEDPLNEYQYDGVVWIGDKTSDMVGTRWVIYQYQSTQVNPQPRTDTLEFISPSDYKYNGQSSSYSLYVSGSSFSLALNQTPFGNLSGSGIPSNFISYGEIVDKKFTDASGSSEYKLWMRKL